MITSRRHRYCTTALACAVALATLPRPGAAEEPPAARPPAGGAEDQDRRLAEERFFTGQKLYGEVRFADALAAFRASCALVVSPDSRLYIARCLLELGDPAGAYDEFTAVILESAGRGGPVNRYGETQRAATLERSALRAQVATLLLRVPLDVPGLSVRVGAAPVAAARWNRPRGCRSASLRCRRRGRCPACGTSTSPGRATRRASRTPSIERSSSGCSPRRPRRRSMRIR